LYAADFPILEHSYDFTVAMPGDGVFRDTIKGLAATRSIADTSTPRPAKLFTGLKLANQIEHVLLGSSSGGGVPNFGTTVLGGSTTIEMVVAFDANTQAEERLLDCTTADGNAFFSIKRVVGVQKKLEFRAKAKDAAASSISGGVGKAVSNKRHHIVLSADSKIAGFTLYLNNQVVAQSQAGNELSTAFYSSCIIGAVRVS
tara:strand:- start:1640 stop:2242 length:603 start_codon:yes stop_codon:yes gene_type:complete